MSSIHQALLEICREDQASGKQRVLCDGNKAIGEVSLSKVTKGKWEILHKRGATEIVVTASGR